MEVLQEKLLVIQIIIEMAEIMEKMKIKTAVFGGSLLLLQV